MLDEDYIQKISKHLEEVESQIQFIKDHLNTLDAAYQKKAAMLDEHFIEIAFKLRSRIAIRKINRLPPETTEEIEGDILKTHKFLEDMQQIIGIICDYIKQKNAAKRYN